MAVRKMVIVKKSLLIVAGFIFIINKNYVNEIYIVAIMVVKEVLFRVVPPFATQLVHVLVDACRSIRDALTPVGIPDDI